jgi:hypothetical protein
LKFSNPKKLIISSILLFGLAISGTGCSNSNMDDLVNSKDETYNHEQSDTVVVEHGDLAPSFDMTLELAGYYSTQYNMLANEYNKYVEKYEIEIDEVLVNVGDTVEAGDTMVSFKSDKLDTQKAEKRKTITEKTIEIEHLRRLMAIDPNEDHNSEIVRLQQEVNVAELYLSDIDEIYNKMNIIADKRGTVVYINDSLGYGFVEIGKPLITVDSSYGYYTFSSTEDIPLEIGKIYKAQNSVTHTDYDIKCIASPDEVASSTDADTSESEDSSTDDSSGADKDKKASETDAASKKKSKPGGENTFYFKPVEESDHLEKIMSVNVTLKTIPDAVYVNRRAISFKDDGNSYVIRINEDGTKTGIKVDVGQIYNDIAIIKSGLKGGETLTLF